RRALLAAPGQQKPGPESIDGGGEAVDGEAPEGFAERTRAHQRIQGLMQDQESGHNDQYALDYRGEILGLMVAELVAAGGGGGGEENGEKGKGRVDRFDDASQRSGKRAPAPGNQIGKILEPKTHPRHDN